MKSKKVLFELMAQRFPTKAPIRIGTYSIDDETYGRKSFIYFFNIESNWGMSRPAFEELLRGWGFKPNRRYATNMDATEVQVSYFKGWHWDE